MSTNGVMQTDEEWEAHQIELRREHHLKKLQGLKDEINRLEDQIQRLSSIAFSCHNDEAAVHIERAMRFLALDQWKHRRALRAEEQYGENGR